MDDTSRASPPPRYSESTSQAEDKPTQVWAHGASPWLVGKTSIHVESSSAIATNSAAPPSITNSKLSEGTSQLRGFFKRDNATISSGDSFARGNEVTPLGTQVTIEAAQPIKSAIEKRIEMKGLEQAASAKRWTGNSEPAEAWGKLMKDPEVWDSDGDTFIYFGYQRPHPSFRVKSSTLEETKSEHIINKLRDGSRKDVKHSRTLSHSTASSFIGHAGAKPASLAGKTKRLDLEAREDPSIKYEIYFPAPPDASRLDVLRHHMTTRNFFAVLDGKSLVGLTFYQALVDLQERLEDLIPGANSAQTLIRYLVRVGLHNVSNDPVAAAGLLAWSEDNFWQEGWREAYVHCTGMNSILRQMPEYRDISHVSRALLERSSLDLQVRIQETEDRLREFQYDDMWPARLNGSASAPPAFLSFRQFLVRFYEKAYKTWPPRARDGGSSWISKSLIHRLRTDFCALYNYYVDPDITWDDTNSHFMRRVPRQTPSYMSCDDPSFERAILTFDQKHNYAHIPHPQPLLPQSVAVGEAARQSQSKSLFGSRAKALEKKILASSAKASNAILLGPDITSNQFIEAYLKFDRHDRIGEEDPMTVRKSRWILLYGLLQTLSAFANDPPHMWFKEDAHYFLNTKLKDLPPWDSSDPTLNGTHEESVHFWLTPKAA